MLVIAVTFILSAKALGSHLESVEFDRISYGGTGCPAGTMGTPDMKVDSEIEIPFDSFFVETGFSNGRRIDRKSCSLAIPFRSYGEVSIALVAAPEGFVDLQGNSTLKFQQEIFFPGARDPLVSKNFEGPLSQNFSADDFGFPDEIAWSPCSSSGMLRLNLSAIAQGSSFGGIERLRMKVLVRSCDSFQE